MISPTCTLIKLSTVNRLYSSKFQRLGVSRIKLSPKVSNETRSSCLVSRKRYWIMSAIYDWSASIFSTGTVFVTLPTGCRSRRKSIQGWTRYRKPSWERSSSVLCARKTRSNPFCDPNSCSSLNVRCGSLIRRPENDGTLVQLVLQACSQGE